MIVILVVVNGARRVRNSSAFYESVFYLVCIKRANIFLKLFQYRDPTFDVFICQTDKPREINPALKFKY